MGRKTIHCIVGMKGEGPFAVLVACGDDVTSSLDVIEMPTSVYRADASRAEERPTAAMHHALRALGFEPSRLTADGFEEPVMMLDELTEEVTFEELQRSWAMKLLAPKKQP